LEKSKLVIVTVVLNDINGLKKTIDSLKCISDDKIRSHFIFDGGSSDGTDQFLSEYKSNQNNSGYSIDYVVEKDKGIFDAMNKSHRYLRLVEHNSSDYIWYLNAGDLAIDFNFPDSNLDSYNLLFFNCEVFFPIFNRKINRPGLITNDQFKKWIKIDTPVHQAVLFSCRIIDLLNFDLFFKHQADSKLIYELLFSHDFYFVEQSICLFEYGGNSSNYKKMRKCLEQLSEQIFIIVVFRNAKWFQILKTYFIFLIKYIFTNIFGVSIFEKMHYFILKFKFFLTRKNLYN
jgi:hypothetical protein